jgi:threonine dehydrogenase-like Zn-dependent dehydrogenase
MWNPHVVTRKQLQVFGSWSSEPRHLHQALEFLAANRERFPFHETVTHRMTLDHANEALELTASFTAAKTAFVFGGPE